LKKTRKEPRKNHTIPKFYLDRFAANQQIEVLALWENRRRYVSSTVKVATERDFYMAVKEDGTKTYDIEKALSGIEGEAAKAMHRLAYGVLFPPSIADRYALSTFLAYQFMRTPEQRRHLEAMSEYLQAVSLKLVTSDSQAQAYLRKRGVHTPTLDEVRAVLHRAELAETQEYILAPNEYLRLMHTMAMQMAPIIYAMRWVVGRFLRDVLVTSDHPITYYTIPGTRPSWVGTGLATADEVWFPLDPRHILMMEPPTGDPDEHLELDDSWAVAFNQNTVAHAWEYVFMTPGFDLTGFRLPRKPRPIVTVSEGWLEGKLPDGINAPPIRRRHRRT